MKLLFDNNISIRMTDRLMDIFPDASHVALIGLDRADDLTVWRYAYENNFCIVTKDSDFCDLCVIRGFPPQIIWLRIGNCTTQQIETLLRTQSASIYRFLNDPVLGIMVLF
jgi:predicted nuclease of predicted toxin-antitoxin system